MTARTRPRTQRAGNPNGTGATDAPGNSRVPYDENAEAALLGAAMLARPALEVLATRTRPDDFYVSSHKDVAAALLAALHGGWVPDTVTIYDELVRQGNPHKLTTADLIALESSTPATSSAARYADIIATKALARREHAAGKELVLAIETGDEPSRAAALTRLAELRATADPGYEGRLVPGGAFILDTPTTQAAVWGCGDQILWPDGETLLLTGPTGVGKTTLAHQIVLARIAVGPDTVLNWPTAPSERTLYLACDRPAQIRRAFRRLVADDDRSALDDRLVIWRGPPPGDLAQEPRLLTQLAAAAGADTVVIDSLKDVAIGISDDEVGAAVNIALQHTLADGCQVLALHHQRKGRDGTRPKTLEDVYGSTWIPAGAGSVLLVWGRAGDIIVELHHLKPPAEEISPLKLEHDHATGRTTVYHEAREIEMLRAAPGGLSAIELGRMMFEREPNDNERKKAKRRLDRLVTDGLAHRYRGTEGGAGGREPDRYYAVEHRRKAPSEPPPAPTLDLDDQPF